MFHLNRVGYKVVIMVVSMSVIIMFHLNRVGYKAGFEVRQKMQELLVSSEPCGI